MELNVHKFDGTLVNPLDTTYSKEDRLTILADYSRLIDTLYSPVAKQALTKILGSDEASNIDTLNHIDAGDLLAHLCLGLMVVGDSGTSLREDTMGLVLILGEQLEDFMAKGQCAQGRTTRILQVHDALEGYWSTISAQGTLDDA
jgi:hypothetical protein